MASRLRHFALLALMALLAACNAPGAGFGHRAPVRVTVGDSQFDVRVRGARAEAIRRSPEWAPRFAAVAPRAILAIEAVSGCRVAHLGGDQAVIRARLACGPALPPASPLPHGQVCDGQVEPDGHITLYCDPVF